MSDMKSFRKQLFVDPKVQGALVKRVVVYWVFCLCTIATMLFCWDMLTGPARAPWKHFDAMWFHYGPALIASILVLPLIIVDIVRMSNRFAGPLVRLRRSMRKLAQGEYVEPIKFRDDDFWKEFADEFNTVVARVQGDDPNTPTEPDHHEETEPIGIGAE